MRFIAQSFDFFIIHIRGGHICSFFFLYRVFTISNSFLKCRILSGSWSCIVVCVPAHNSPQKTLVKFGFTNIPSLYPNRLRKTYFYKDNTWNTNEDLLKRTIKLFFFVGIMNNKVLKLESLNKIARLFKN